MKNLLCLLCFVCLVVAGSFAETEIESLRVRVQDSSAELTGSEMGIISQFWRSTLDQMMLSETSKECVEFRRLLAEQKGSSSFSPYAIFYVAEAKTAIEAALSDTQRMEDPAHRQMILRNLIILAAELQSPKLASIVLPRLSDEDGVIRYWAYKAVTDSSLIQQLTSDITGDPEATATILTALKKNASVEKQTQIQKMVIRFCMAMDNPLARDTLVLVADGRIKAYRDWTVRDEILDVTLLTALGNVAVLQKGEVQKVFGQKFAELYAAAFQRYLKGKDFLSKTQIDQLLTVIAEVDKTVVIKTFGIKTGTLSALKSKRGLDREYETLFGDRMRAGQLATQFKFDYGKDASGKSITAPQELGPAPESIEK